MSIDEAQHDREVAERYQGVVVPAILGPFARALVEASPIRPGDKVLDLGCGTGAASRAAALKTGPSGAVTAIDLNEGMLSVARSLPTEGGAAIAWHRGNAMKLALDDHSQDVVICAQVLQFLPDRPVATAHIRRVLVDGGVASIGVWSALADNPYFEALIETVAKHLGDDVAKGLGAAFSLPGADDIRALLEGAGLRGLHFTLERRVLGLPPPGEFVALHIAATPMSVAFTSAPIALREKIVAEVDKRLAAFRNPAGIAVPFVSHFVHAVSRSSP